ncbi:pyruvate dehydrogenase (acetyl-transferring), homodimeric type [Solirubrobacter taibaiensis]|nr:pyruvate dehydrogenase (acetyl-transferring), homodimeric type [Solirubrobacter taibaiensis]
MASQVEVDPQETREWLEALDAVVASDGPQRAQFLLERVVGHAQLSGATPAPAGNTPYLNTIPPQDEPSPPGDEALERRVRSIVRWNAIATILNANKDSSELGGHIASYQSAAVLYETGFNHFWHAPSDNHGGDLVFMQGHSSPGVYARAFLEGRLSEEQMRNFRTEAYKDGLSSYPHPWLMPDFWQFPTVSMGLGPLMAIYQARFMKYLQGRGLAETAGRKVWAFMGDGEMDEPESLGAISMAGREKLDNLIFVINCNLQRLDGPVRGNGKIIQELETNFRGNGWNVIKTIWGSRWDPLLAADHEGHLLARMNEALDGDYQTYKSRNGAYVREHFFGTKPELRAMVDDMSDDQIWALNRGGLDSRKVYAAYKSATEHHGQPTVILAKTIKGYGMGTAGEGQNITHQQKKMNEEALLAFRDRFELELTDDQVRNLSFYKPPEGSPEAEFIREQRAKLGGSLPARRRKAESLPTPELSAFQSQLDGTGDREVSTTMSFVRILSTLLRDKQLGKRIVPIVPDESRTFGMEGLFRQLGIFSQLGQLYTPEDRDQLMFYREDKHGQVLQEGINEPGAMSSFIAAGTSYSNHAAPTIPFYIYYSMFGFQRIGDLAWAAGDSRTRGFMLGGTAGRTTLNGEGLQHEDGHSHLVSATIPNCVSYDPTYGYELAVIIREGLRRMFTEQEDVFYYLTLMNENYQHPAMPEGAEEGILRGLYKLAPAAEGEAQIQLLGSGVILREVLEAQKLLADDFGVAADVWSVPSFTELAREAQEVDRWNTFHPGEEAKTSWVQEQLGAATGPVVASTDYMRAFADQIRPFIDQPYRVLGTDGFGRSDYRKTLRSFFEVDRHHVVLAALTELAKTGEIDASAPKTAIESYQIDPERPAPWRV